MLKISAVDKWNHPDMMQAAVLYIYLIKLANSYTVW